MTQPLISPESRQKTAALLTDLWERNRPLIERRLALLERAAAGPFPIPDDLRAEAGSVAHKLAGSLGMFGYERGTEIAREMEVLLESQPVDDSRLASFAAQLRSVLFPKS